MTRTICFVLFLLSFGSLFSQIQGNYDSKYDFNYAHLDSMRNSRMVRLDLAPAHIGVHGEHLAFAAGGTFAVQHFLNRLSLDATIFYRYYAENWVNEWPGFVTQATFYPFTYKGVEYDAHLSYSVLKRNKMTKSRVILKQERGRNIVSDFPVNEIQLLDVRLGYSYFELPSYLDLSESGLGWSSLYFKQNVRALSLGLSFKKMHYEKWKTNKYGDQSSSKFSEFFVNVLLGINPTFPERIFEPVFVPIDNSYVYTESTAEKVEEFTNTLPYQRIGGVVGYRVTPYSNGMSIATTLGYRPRYLGTEFQIRGLLTFGLTISYTLMAHRNNLERVRELFVE